MEKELNEIVCMIEEFNKSKFSVELELRMYSKEKRPYTKLEKIMEDVCKATGITPEYLTMKTREQKILLPRQMAHYIAAKRTRYVLSAIGAFFGGKDHATVLNSVRKIQNLIDTDKEFREKYGDLLSSGHLVPTNGNS